MTLVSVTPDDNVIPFRKPPKLERALGNVRLGFRRRGGATAVSELFQSGCAKVRFPTWEAPAPREAILLNTAGGLTDEDRVRYDISWGPGTRAVVTTQASERIYRSRQAPAQMQAWLNVGPNALAFWLPQETILFNGSNLRRRAMIDVDPLGRMVACESLIFGRAAMGETLDIGAIRDSWRVRFAGQLVFADDFRVAGHLSSALDRRAIAGGARCIATILYVGEDAAALVPVLREIEQDGRKDPQARLACSCLGPVLVTRVIAEGSLALRKATTEVLHALLETLAATGAPSCLPRVWAN